jgi:signal transduction histidine kinase
VVWFGTIRALHAAPETGGHCPRRANVRAVMADGDVLWVGTVHSPSAPAARLEPQKIRAPWIANGANVTAFATEGGQTWVGTSRGLFRSVGQDLIPQRLLRETNAFDTQGIGTEKIRALAAGLDGALWIVTPHLVSVLQRGEDLPRPFIRFDAKGKPISPMACAIDRTGALWVATDGAGVVKFSRESLLGSPVGMKLEDLALDGAAPAFVRPPDLWLTASNSLPSDHAWDFYEAADGAMWIATERGVVRLAPGSAGPSSNAAFTFTTAEGLPNHQVNSLIEDGNGNVWFGTDDGVFVVSHAGLLDVVDGRTNRVSARTISAADGMPDPETNGRLSHPGACRTSDGRIWFATVKGVAVVDPTQLLGREEEAPVAALEVVRVDGEVVLANAPPEGAGATTLLPEARRGITDSGRTSSRATSPRLRLDPGRARTIEFQFVGLSFTSPEGCRYEFRLDGHDGPGLWHDARAQRFALYTNLKPGEFRFQVRVANRHGRWCERPASYDFSLAPFFWQTGWFQAGTPLLALVLVGALVRWRLNEKDRFHRLETDRRIAEEQLVQEQELARERARIARNLHDDMGASLVQLGLLVNRLDPSETATSAAREAAHRLAETVAEANRLLRETLWTVHPTDETVAGLADRLCGLATDTLTPLRIAARFELPEVLPSTRLSARQRSEFIRAYREVLTNIVKHAGATELHLAISATQTSFRAAVRDNGRGFDISKSGSRHPDAGRGLGNIRTRLADVRGTALVESTPGQGTCVTLELPL